MKEIKSMYDQFYRAHSGTSFSPDKRAETDVKAFSAELQADLSELGENNNYKEKYLAHVSRWLGRRSRVMSTMIAGPANFPVYRNRKAIAADMRAWEEFRRWRERYIKRATAERTRTPEEEIDDALEKLDKARDYHQKMLDVNKVLRMKNSDEEKVEELKGMMIDLPEKALATGGFPSYELTNSRARIKNLEDKLIIMRQRIENRDSFEPIQFDGGSINIENDRVVIYHDEKPAQEVINDLKAHGFRWSPKFRCWCRKHTANAIRAAKHICKIA